MNRPNSITFLLILFLLLACSEPVKNTPEKEEIFGWRSTGLEIIDDSEGGFQRMTYNQEHLFVMDAYAPNWLTEEYEREKEQKWRVHHLDIQTGVWDTLPLPEGEYAQSIYLLDDVLYLGTKYTGNLWAYDLDEYPNATQIEFEKPGSEIDSERQRVYITGEFGGRVMVSYLTLDSNLHKNGLIKYGDKFVEIPGVFYIDDKYWPADKIIEFKGWAYGISAQFGLFRWKPGMDKWEKLPSPRGADYAVEDEFINAIAVHDEKLHVGYFRHELGVYRQEEDGTWTHLTPSVQGVTESESPRDVNFLFSYQDHLWMGGIGGSSPRRYDPLDPDCPRVGDWKLTEDVLLPEGTSYGTQSWGMAGIGDTLYISWWNFVLKAPIEDVLAMDKPVLTPKAYEIEPSPCK